VINRLVDIRLLGRILANVDLGAQGSAYFSFYLLGTKK